MKNENRAPTGIGDAAKPCRTIIDGDRLHDRVNAVVAVLLEQKQLFQLEGALVRRRGAGKQVVLVTEIWLDDYLRQRFQFVKDGLPVKPQPPLARFVLRRWCEFPAVLKTGRAG